MSPRPYFRLNGQLVTCCLWWCQKWAAAAREKLRAREASRGSIHAATSASPRLLLHQPSPSAGPPPLTALGGCPDGCLQLTPGDKGWPRSDRGSVSGELGRGRVTRKQKCPGPTSPRSAGLTPWAWAGASGCSTCGKGPLASGGRGEVGSGRGKELGVALFCQQRAQEGARDSGFLLRLTCWHLAVQQG